MEGWPYQLIQRAGSQAEVADAQAGLPVERQFGLDLGLDGSSFVAVEGNIP